MPERASSSASGKQGVRSADAFAERGFLLALLLPVLALLAIFLVGTWRFTERAQARVALQSRLDECAVRAAVARERLFARLGAANAGVNDTKLAIYALRAAALVPGAGEAAMAGQEALLALNKSLAAAEDLLLATGAAAELGKLRCPPTSYSHEAAACVALPPVGAALEHEETLFPDVRGPLRHRKEGRRLARIRCAGPHGLSTTLEVTGDPGLRSMKGYEDAYETKF